MYVIQAKTRIDRDYFINNQDVKEPIISSLLVDFAAEMLSQQCVEISEITQQGKVFSLDPEEVEIRVKGYVMAPEEIKRAIELMNAIKPALSPIMQVLADELYKLLTTKIK